ncbi:hypothetical protein NC653_000308 [Populus alba x Populus x berolinensis]|uniref:Uncharacterized protein n=1 Tax=Populus alba x Populus x berolinensis TaxID=444605 RepID=A0AAD6RIS4_9ROSI|nr:hypothetical protein NC653_000308 [Populus alba x Populus x berolinensis]
MPHAGFFRVRQPILTNIYLHRITNHNTSPAPPSLHACTGAVQTSSQTDLSVTAPCVGQAQRPSTAPTAPLEVNYCDGAASSPTRTNNVATTAGDMVLVSNLVNVPPVCIGDVQPPPIASCDGEAHSSSPSATTTGDTVVVGNSVKVPLINVADQCGVRTRNQKQRSQSGREFPSPTKGKEVAISADANGKTRRHKAATGMLTRSSVQTNFNMSSGSGGDSPTIPHP